MCELCCSHGDRWTRALCDLLLGPDQCLSQQIWRISLQVFTTSYFLYSFYEYNIFYVFTANISLNTHSYTCICSFCFSSFLFKWFEWQFAENICVFLAFVPVRFPLFSPWISSRKVSYPLDNFSRSVCESIIAW